MSDDEMLAAVRDALASGNLGHPDEGAAQAVVEAAEPLWDALGELSLVDGWGGGEFRSLFPDVLVMIVHRANFGAGGHKPCPDLRDDAAAAAHTYMLLAKRLVYLSPRLFRLDEMLELGLLTREEHIEAESDLLRGTTLIVG